MKNIKDKKIQFLPGLGEKPRQYRQLSKYIETLDVDWNTGKITPSINKCDILVGFSMGAILVCEYALKHKVKKLILCSLTPMVESLNGIKTNEVVFMVGSKEKFCLKNIRRVSKALKCKVSIIIVPDADHKIISLYQKKLLEIITKQ